VTAPRKLALFGVVLAGTLGLSMAVGSASPSTGLANVEPEAPEHGGAMAGGMSPGLSSAEEDYRLVADTDTLAARRAATYRFHIEGDDGPVTEFDIAHTKPMHLIVVRRDFVGFQHLHPARDEAGTWTIPMLLSDPGTYRVFADFVVDGDKHTLATDLFVPGDFQPEALPGHDADADAGDGYTTELVGDAVVGEESTLEFVVRHDGTVVDDLSEYLGARGHLVALRDGDLAYLHVHADEERLSFEAEFPTAGSYRLFLQFRHGGHVRTAAFTIDAHEEDR
jgi:hypothetical protein